MTPSYGKMSHIAMRVSQMAMGGGLLLVEGGLVAQRNPAGTRGGLLAGPQVSVGVTIRTIQLTMDFPDIEGKLIVISISYHCQVPARYGVRIRSSNNGRDMGGSRCRGRPRDHIAAACRRGRRVTRTPGSRGPSSASPPPATPFASPWRTSRPWMSCASSRGRPEAELAVRLDRIAAV